VDNLDMPNEIIEMHHFEVTVVKRLSGKAEPTINTPPHLSRHPNTIHKNEQFCIKAQRNGVR
jgi:hypothetical protein